MNVSGLKNICLTSWQTHHCCWQIQIICRIKWNSNCITATSQFYLKFKIGDTFSSLEDKKASRSSTETSPHCSGELCAAGTGVRRGLGRAVTVGQCPGILAWQFGLREDGMWVLSRTPGTERCCLRHSHCREQTIGGDSPGVCGVSQVRTLLNWLLCGQFFPQCVHRHKTKLDKAAEIMIAQWWVMSSPDFGNVQFKKTWALLRWHGWGACAIAIAMGSRVWSLKPQFCLPGGQAGKAPAAEEDLRAGDGAGGKGQRSPAPPNPPAAQRNTACETGLGACTQLTRFYQEKGRLCQNKRPKKPRRIIKNPSA